METITSFDAFDGLRVFILLLGALGFAGLLALVVAWALRDNDDTRDL